MTNAGNKAAKITFWITTSIIFLLEGVMSAATSHTEMAHQGITHLGYPLYFGTMLMVFKVLGSLALMIPSVPKNVKEWAYAGFGIDFVAAFVSIAAVDGMGSHLAFPVVAMVILILSYISYHKINA